jgi:hypothetical protein
VPANFCVQFLPVAALAGQPPSNFSVAMTQFSRSYDEVNNSRIKQPDR